MKLTRTTIVFFLVLLCTAPAFAVERDIQGKLGTGYAYDPSKFGLDFSLQYNWVLDPYFALGAESGFYWIYWSRKIASGETVGISSDIKADTNAYMIPVIANAQLRLPNLIKKIYVMPYVTVGLGYSFMMIHYSEPDIAASEYDGESVTKFFKGFTWQLIAGAGYQPEGSNVEFIGELGYRRAALKTGTTEIDMSGLVIRLGVKYPLGNK